MSSMSSKPTSTSKTPTSAAFQQVHVLVVESHQHVLEHTHYVLRRSKRLLGKSWSMLHFDAHPDLACPHSSIPAAACYHPRKTWPTTAIDKNQSSETSSQKSPATDIYMDDTDENDDEKDLYELLDSTSTGIAEWILPLVLAANLTAVQWVRPSGQILKQFPLGEHQYNVGAWDPVSKQQQQEEGPSSSVLSFLDLPPSALVKVDRNCPYYQDDDTSVPSQELLLPKLFDLLVSELQLEEQQCQNPRERDERSPSTSHVHLDSPWMLDICLDYFACLNPFVTDIETLDPTFSRAFCDCVLNSIFYVDTENKRDNNKRGALATFRTLLSEELERAGACDKDDADFVDDVAKSSLQPLLAYYESPKAGERLLTALVTSLRTSTGDRTRIATMAVEALPNLTMPHDYSHQTTSATLTSTATTTSNMEALLPSIQAVDTEIRLHQTEAGANNNPFIITIARSSADGFTPDSVVEELQAAVLTMIHTMYCNCAHGAPLTPTKGQEVGQCRMNLVFDYGQWEGSSFDF